MDAQPPPARPDSVMWDGKQWLSHDGRFWWDGHTWKPNQGRPAIWAAGCVRVFALVVGIAFLLVVAVFAAIAIPEIAFENRCSSAGGQIMAAYEVNDVITDPLDRVCVVHGKVAFHEYDHR